MKKKLFARILAAVLVFSMGMTACGNAGVSEPTGSVQDTSSKETSSQEVKETKEYWEMLGEVSDSSELPDWEGEILEVKLWVAGGADRVLGTIPETNVTFKEMERVTGVRFNIEESYGNGGEGIDGKLPKIIASKDYPTMVYGWGIASQLRELYDHGYLADLTEYYENGDLWGVEYWMPREYGENNLYTGCHTENGEYFLIPSDADPDFLYENTGYTVDEYNTEYYSMYGGVPTSAGGVNITHAVWVRDDILKAIYPDALTMDEIENIYVEKGVYTEAELFDIGLETTEDFFQLLRDIQAELATGNYVGLDGKPMEVFYGPNTEMDNWDWLTTLPLTLGEFSANANYFSSFINDDDPSTPLIVRTWEQDDFVDFMRNMNALVNENVISKNSLVDNGATFTEKLTNAHYAVAMGNAAYNSLPRAEEYESVVDWDYRPIYVSQAPSDVYGGVVPGGATTSYVGIFKDAVTDEQLDQLVHALSYMASPVGVKCFEWGPKSAGLFEEDANGVRTFIDPELTANIVNRETNDSGYKYGLKRARSESQQLSIDAISLTGLSGNLLDPSYTLAQGLPREKGRAARSFNPGVLAEYSMAANAIYINTDTFLHSYGVSNFEEINEWWSARPGFEKQLTKVIVCDPADFDAELEALSTYSESTGLTDEVMDKLNAKFIEDNKDRLDAAGIVY